jgi:hypothetical protein
MGDIKIAYKLLVGKPEGYGPFGRDGAYGRMILKWTFRKACEGVDKMHLGQDSVQWLAVVNTVMHVWDP